MRRSVTGAHYFGMGTLSQTERGLAVLGEGVALDVQLLERMVAGNREASATLYDFYVRPVHAYSMTHLDHREDAEEITQDVFIALWEKRGSIIVHGTSILPWLLVTCKNMIANRRRALETRNRRTSSSDIVDEITPSTTPTPEQTLQTRELVSTLEAAINSLPDADRVIFETCVLDGLSYSAAADRIGVSSGAIRNRLSRVRIRLRGELRTLKGTS